MFFNSESFGGICIILVISIENGEMFQATTQHNLLHKFTIATSILGCVLGFGLFLLWVHVGAQWPIEQTLMKKTTHPRVAITLMLWGGATLALFVGGIVAKRIKSGVVCVFLAAATWFLLGLFLTYATPFTARVCTTSFEGGYDCHALDLRYKLFIMLLSLGFPALLGLMASIGTWKLQYGSE